MRKISIMVTIMLVIIMAFQALSFAKGNQTYREDNKASFEVIKTFDQSINEIVRGNKAKGAVAVFVQDGEVVLTKGYGYADERLELKSNGEKIGFRIGSISKTFVAVAALKAMQDGLLDMNTDITTYLGEDSPKLKYPVSMHNLLTHTAGFEEEITGMAVKNVSDTEPLSKTIIKYTPEQIFKPDEVASYSNYGIALAAYVIEHVTNEDFKDYCRNNIFLPLGMNRTTFKYTHDIVYVSKAYLPNGDETNDLFMNLYPEGSAVSTAEDMGKYLKWLLEADDRILSNDNKEELFSRQYFMADELSGIGYVWNRKTRNGSLYLEKKGETLHFYSRIVIYPESKTGFFLSFNTYVPEEDIDGITAKVTNLLLGEKENLVSKSGATIDIDGCYVNAWSSFKTAEKLLRFIVPGKMIDISGSLKSGYTLNDEKIVHIGNNTYDTPIGIVKFTERDGKVLLATDFSQTYIRINGLENKGVTLITTLLFLLSSLICLILSFKSHKKLFGLLSLAQIILFTCLGGIIYLGILNYSILSYTVYINITAWLIVFTTIANMKFTFKNKAIKYFYFHNAISLTFCLVLYNLNLLF